MIVFKIGERVVGATRSTRQRTIARCLERLASAHPGHEVTAYYPPDYRADEAHVQRGGIPEDATFNPAGPPYFT